MRRRGLRHGAASAGACGDTILVHAGFYRYSHLEYGGANRTFPFEGTYYLTADGTPERPIGSDAPL